MKTNNTDYNWIIKVFLLSFGISIIFSLTSESLLEKANIFGSIIILLIFISIGILFDIIGVAVTSADEKIFHSMNAKKVKGANIAVLFKKNADRVSSFCNDIVGDICGIVSGSATIIIATTLSSTFKWNILIVSLLLTGLVAALTIGGKATGKGFAIKNSSQILYRASSIVAIFYKPKNKKN